MIFRIADLRRAELAGANLAGADLRNALLNGASLAGTDLQNADLAEATLPHANLQEAVLDHADLSHANLGGAKLNRAKLRNACLFYAYLVNANLSAADLSSAVLDGAELDDAILYKADLRESKFSQALLYGTNFTGADVSGAEFNDAHLMETVFADVDLGQVRNLETCQHDAPSIIDHRTLQRSGQLPLSFLRGCGLPDNLIEYLPSLFNQPIQFYSCFISYSSQDEEFAGRLHADLQDNGIRCWFAPEDMKIGDRIRTRIDEVIRLHEKLLLVLSANSIDSDWVEKEVETAFEKERESKSTVLFPVRLDDAMESKTGWAADIKRTRHIGDFRRWKDHDVYRNAFERLVRDLRVEAT